MNPHKLGVLNPHLRYPRLHFPHLLYNWQDDFWMLGTSCDFSCGFSTNHRCNHIIMRFSASSGVVRPRAIGGLGSDADDQTGWYLRNTWATKTAAVVGMVVEVRAETGATKYTLNFHYGNWIREENKRWKGEILVTAFTTHIIEKERIIACTLYITESHFPPQNNESTEIPISYNRNLNFG